MATTRRLPEGIRKLDNGRYQARYTIVRDGRHVQVSAGTFASLTDAKDARAVAVAQLRTGVWVDPRHSRMTVRDWVKEWTTARPVTSEWLQTIIDKRIIPAWGDTRLEDITALSIQHWVNGMTSQGLSARTVQAYYGVLRTMLSQAVVYGKLPATPCAERAVRLPTLSKTEPVLLSVEDMELLEQAAPARYKAMISVACWTGLRWGELAGLRWQDIEWERSTIHVQQAAKRDGSFGLPKNRKKRRVPIDAELIAVLRQHRRDFGDGADGLVFTSTRKTALRYPNFRKVWIKMTEALSLDVAPTFHDLRHAHAGHMVMQGMDWLVLSERLGHHSPAFTMSRYGWARPDKHEVTMAMLSAARGVKA